MEIRFYTKNVSLLLITLFAVVSYAEKKPVAVNKEMIENFVVAPLSEKNALKKDPLLGVQLDFTKKYNIMFIHTFYNFWTFTLHFITTINI